MSRHRNCLGSIDSIRIEAPRARVWELVIAMERYGEWSSENAGGYWRKGERRYRAPAKSVISSSE